MRLKCDGSTCLRNRLMNSMPLTVMAYLSERFLLREMYMFSVLMWISPQCRRHSSLTSGVFSIRNLREVRYCS